MKSARLVLFDFDGTLTTRDTLIEFCKFHAGRLRFATGILVLLPVLIGQKIRLISSQRAKEILLAFYFGGMHEKIFKEKCIEFTIHLSKIIRQKAIDEINRYKEEGVRMIIVSASPENWIKPWADRLGLEVIATKLIFMDSRFTGMIEGYNCNGIEKVNRIKAEINLLDYQEIIAYGDSEGDNPMLSMANKVYFKPFR